MFGLHEIWPCNLLGQAFWSHVHSTKLLGVGVGSCFLVHSTLSGIFHWTDSSVLKRRLVPSFGKNNTLSNYGHLSTNFIDWHLFELGNTVEEGSGDALYRVVGSSEPSDFCRSFTAHVNFLHLWSLSYIMNPMIFLPWTH